MNAHATLDAENTLKPNDANDDSPWLTEEEKNRMAEEHFKLIYLIVNQFCRYSDNYGDLVDAAMLGMVKALNTYNKGKGVKFTSYSGRCMKNEILMFFRREKKNKQNVSLEQSLATDEAGDALTFLDTLSLSENNPENKIDWKEIRLAVSKVMNNISERNRQIFSLALVENVPHREIGERFGLKQSTISRVISKIQEKIKQEYEA